MSFDISLAGLKFFSCQLTAFRELCSPDNGLLLRNLSGKRDWENVVRHSIMAGAATHALATACRVDQVSLHNLVAFMLVHDSDKRLQKERRNGDCSPGGPPQPSASLLNTLDPERLLRAATSEAYIVEQHHQRATLPQKIAHVVDTMCLENTLVAPAERIAQTALRRTDLSRAYWAQELTVTERECRELVCVIQEHHDTQTITEPLWVWLTARVRETFQ